MFNTQNTLLFFSALSSALVAGLLYGYSCSVNPGLGKLSDGPYILAMQSINREILNPLFFISFFGCLILLPVTGWFSYVHARPAVFQLLLGACLLYILGVMGVTMAGNVPLNDALAKMNVQAAAPEELEACRKHFETSWNRLHAIRAFCSLISFVFILLAIFKQTQNEYK